MERQLHSILSLIFILLSPAISFAGLFSPEVGTQEVIIQRIEHFNQSLELEFSMIDRADYSTPETRKAFGQKHLSTLKKQLKFLISETFLTSILQQYPELADESITYNPKDLPQTLSVLKDLLQQLKVNLEVLLPEKCLSASQLVGSMNKAAIVPLCFTIPTMLIIGTHQPDLAFPLGVISSLTYYYFQKRIVIPSLDKNRTAYEQGMMDISYAFESYSKLASAYYALFKIEQVENSQYNRTCTDLLLNYSKN